jgi:hypothetical protein
MKEWLGDTQQRLMTHLANRTFNQNPGVLDRLAVRLLTKMLGQAPHDPELDHPE